VTGQVVSNKSINVDNAFQIGSKQIESFEGGWPETFHQTIHRSVVTMAIDRKHIQVADSKVYDTEIIYARAMSLHNSIKELSSTHELQLSPVSTAI